MSRRIADTGRIDGRGCREAAAWCEVLSVSAVDGSIGAADPISTAGAFVDKRNPFVDKRNRVRSDGV